MQKNSLAGDVSVLAERIGYTFANEALPRQALTHSSVSTDKRTRTDYERLEFLGDAVLEILCSDFIFRKYPEMSEGNMTRRRAEMVCRDSLAYVARRNGFDELIILGAGERKNKIPDSILEDVTEAVLGSVYLDGGLEAVRPIARRLIFDLEDSLPGRTKDAKSYLQEFLQTMGTELPVYRTVSKEGTDNSPVFTVELSYKGKAVCTATGKRKKEAEQNAARTAIDILKS